MWVVPSDVTNAWLGEGAPTDTAKLTLWIGKAEREIRNQVPDLMARIDAEAALVPASTDLLDTAIDVVVAMVTRVFRNPEQIRQTATTTGPFTESSTFGGDTPGGLEMTAKELAKLQGVQQSGAFTIDLMPAEAMSSYRYPWGWLE